MSCDGCRASTCGRSSTVAAAIAGIAASRCANPTLRAALEQIAEDELRHAALAWQTVRWALAQPGGAAARARLAALVATAVASTTSPDEDPALAAVGRLSLHEEAIVTAEVWREVIAPCRAALLAVPIARVPAAALRA
jgi:hypothetical protein